MNKGKAIPIRMYFLLAPIIAGCNPAGQDSVKSRTKEDQATAQEYGDLGNGYYRNPIIMAGDIADIGSIRVGDDYYLIHFYTVTPGHLIWHSRDLVNWEPVAHMFPGSGGGGDLSQYGDKFYYYSGGRGGITVRTADNPIGPWSEPVSMGGPTWDLTVGSGPDGRRWAVAGFQEVNIMELSEDGMSIVNGPIQVYNGWPIPPEWDIECPCHEGWNVFYKDGYYYLTGAQGGTTGPPTSHMVVAARAPSMEGPWENSPYNPIIHTYSIDEPFWSQGNGRLIDTPDGEWYMFYHAYLNGRRNLGRQIFLAPIEWTDDGWFRIPPDVKLDQPIPKPKGEAVPHGFKLTDDFKGPELDHKWGFPTRSPEVLYRFGEGGIYLKGNGERVDDCVPMVMPVTHTAYEYIVEMTVPPGVIGGATVYYSPIAYTAVGMKDGSVRPYTGYTGDINYEQLYEGNHIFMKMVFQDDLVRMFYSPDGENWTKVPAVGDVSGMHRSTLGSWASVRPGIFACGEGEVVVHNFELRGLP